MPDAVTNALKRKAELESELNEIEQFLALHRKFSGEVVESAAPHEQSEDPIKGDEVINRLMAASHISEKARGRPADFASVIYDLIDRAGVPMSRATIIEKIERRGVKIPSIDKERYISTILWRHRDRFVNLQNYGYWIKDRNCALARYTAGSTHGVISDDDPDSAQIVG